MGYEQTSLLRKWYANSGTGGVRLVHGVRELISTLAFLARSEQNKGRAGGAHYQYELTLDPEIVPETRESIETESRSHHDSNRLASIADRPLNDPGTNGTRGVPRNALLSGRTDRQNRRNEGCGCVPSQRRRWRRRLILFLKLADWTILSVVSDLNEQ